MNAFKWFRRKKSRKYPVKLDEYGRSARSRCFEMFSDRVPLAEIAETVGVKFETVCKYRQQWEKNPDIEGQYAYAKTLFKKTAPDRDKNIELFARALEIRKEEFEAVLSRPHGLRRLMTEKLYFPAHADADHKRHMALKLALMISDHFIKNHGKYVDVYFALRRYMKEYMRYREEEDADIEEYNKRMALMHKVLAADMENERQGRVKPDTLSNEERNAILQFGIESLKKKTEISYLFRVAGMIANGSTPEQACETIYQEFLQKGDLKGAKITREFQDKVQTLIKSGQVPPLSPPQPPSPA